MKNSLVIVKDNLTNGHDSCRPVPWVDNLSTTTMCDGKYIVLLDSKAASHSCIVHSPHIPVLIEASSLVFADGRGFARVGDKCNCPDKVKETTAIMVFTI